MTRGDKRVHVTNTHGIWLVARVHCPHCCTSLLCKKVKVKSEFDCSSWEIIESGRGDLDDFYLSPYLSTPHNMFQTNVRTCRAGMMGFYSRLLALRSLQVSHNKVSHFKRLGTGLSCPAREPASDSRNIICS